MQVKWKKMKVPLVNEFPNKGTICFKDFVARDTNKEVKKAAIDFVGRKSDQNILVISGEIGDGSTFLACAILNEINSRFPSETVFFITLETILYWLKTNQNKEILNPKYLDSHYAIVIDSYFDKRGQKEFEKFLLILKNVKTKIVITCNNDVHVDIDFFRIRIQPRSNKEKAIILRKVLKNEDVVFPRSVIHYLANSHYSGVRELVNMVIVLLAASAIFKCKINLPFVKRQIEKIEMRRT